MEDRNSDERLVKEYSRRDFLELAGAGTIAMILNGCGGGGAGAIKYITDVIWRNDYARPIILRDIPGKLNGFLEDARVVLGNKEFLIDFELELSNLLDESLSLEGREKIGEVIAYSEGDLQKVHDIYEGGLGYSPSGRGVVGFSYVTMDDINEYVLSEFDERQAEFNAFCIENFFSRPVEDNANGREQLSAFVNNASSADWISDPCAA